MFRQQGKKVISLPSHELLGHHAHEFHWSSDEHGRPRCRAGSGRLELAWREAVPGNGSGSFPGSNRAARLHRSADSAGRRHYALPRILA